LVRINLPVRISRWLRKEISTLPLKPPKILYLGRDKRKKGEVKVKRRLTTLVIHSSDTQIDRVNIQHLPFPPAPIRMLSKRCAFGKKRTKATWGGERDAWNNLDQLQSKVQAHSGES